MNSAWQANFNRKANVLEQKIRIQAKLLGQEYGKLGNRNRVKTDRKQGSFKNKWVLGGIKCQKEFNKDDI